MHSWGNRPPFVRVFVCGPTAGALFGIVFLCDVEPVVQEGRSPSDWVATDWRDTWWFCIFSVFCIFCLLFLAGRKAAKAYRRKHKGKVGARDKAPISSSPKYL